MSKLESKKQIVLDLKEKFAKTSVAVVTDHTGLAVKDVTELRKRLQAINAEYKIAKNTLIRLAIKDTNLTQLEKLLEGPSALLLGYGDLQEPAKILVEFIKEIEKGEIKGGVFEGNLISRQDLRAIANLPPRKVLLGQIAGLLVACPGQIAFILESLIRDIALLVEEVAKKNSGGK